MNHVKFPMTVVTGLVTTTVASALLATPSYATSPSPTPSPQPATSQTPAPETAQSAAAAKAAKVAAKKKAKKAAAKKKALAKKKRVRMLKKKLPLKALKIAKKKKGKPYRRGATGPNAFDCSGLTGWAYAKAGKKLPRTSSAQASTVKRTKKPRKGDLVFFHRGGRVYHVGLYAGRSKVFHASRTGVPVKTEKIWTNSVYYGRVKV